MNASGSATPDFTSPARTAYPSIAELSHGGSTRSDTIFTIDNNLTVGWSFVDLGLSVQNLFDARYRLGEFNYASDFHSQAFPTLVPVRHFSAGPPRIIFFSITLNYGGGR